LHETLHGLDISLKALFISSSNREFPLLVFLYIETPLCCQQENNKESEETRFKDNIVQKLVCFDKACNN